MGFYTGNTQGIPLTGLQNSRGDSDLLLEIAVRNQALENALILFRIRCFQLTKRSHIIVRDLSLLIMLGQGEFYRADILKTGTRQRHLNRLTGSNLLLRNSRNIIGDGGEHSLREVELHRQCRTDAVLSVPRIGVRIIYGAVGQNNLVLQVCREAICRNRQVSAETAVSSRFRGVKDEAAVINLLVGVSVGRRALRCNREATQLIVCQELGAQPGTLHVHGTAVKNVEGAAGHAQSRQGSILLITLHRSVLYGCVLHGRCLKCCLLLASLLRICLLGGGGGRRLVRRRQRRRSNTCKRAQTQQQGKAERAGARRVARGIRMVRGTSWGEE